MYREAIWPSSQLAMVSLMGVRCWEITCGGVRIQHPYPVSNMFYMKVELVLGVLL